MDRDNQERVGESQESGGGEEERISQDKEKTDRRRFKAPCDGLYARFYTWCVNSEREAIITAINRSFFNCLQRWLIFGVSF